jgi:hypothetical protein
MLRPRFRRLAVHCDYGHHPSATLDLTIRCNGLDRLDRRTAAQARAPRPRKPLVRRLTDEQVQEMRHYARLAAKAEAAAGRVL